MRGAARRREAPTNNWHDFYEFTNEVKNFTGLAMYYGLLAATFELRSDFWVLDSSERAKLLGIFSHEFCIYNAGGMCHFGYLEFHQGGMPQASNCDA